MTHTHTHTHTLHTHQDSTPGLALLVGKAQQTMGCTVLYVCCARTMPCNTSSAGVLCLRVCRTWLYCTVYVCSVKCGVVCVRVCVSVCLCTYLSVRLSVCVCQVTGLAVATASGNLAKSCAGCHDYCHGHHVYPQNVWAP